MQSNLLKDNVDLMKEYDYDKNANISLDRLTLGSHKKVWWKCEKGHSWEAGIRSRYLGSGCPFCSNKRVLYGYNDLYTYCIENHREQLLNEFDSSKSGPSMKDVTVGSHKKLWWKCSKGHSYQASPYRRIKIGSGCGICGHRILAEGENDLLTTHPEIAKEWDYNKNQVKPSEVMAGSNHRSYWFICPKGHSYKATLLNRKKGTGCPKCSNEKRTSFPEKAISYYMKQYFGNVQDNYHDSALGAMEIDVYLPDYKIGIEYDGVAWHKDYKRDLEKDARCMNSGILLLRIREKGCFEYDSYSVKKYVEPYSMRELSEAILFVFDVLNQQRNLSIKANVDVDRDQTNILEHLNLSEKENSIADYCPTIIEFWDKEKNGKIMPEQIPHASFKKIHLKCSLGHEWETTAHNFPSYPWCPYCSGRKAFPGFNDLFTTNPDLIPLWSKKNTIDPKKIKNGCNSKAIWNCPKCGSEYEMSVISKASGQGCPYCSGHRVLKGYNDLGTLSPELLKDWDYEKNAPLTPESVTNGSNKKVWWKCHVCHHEWKTTVNNRTGSLKRSCPKCGREKSQKSTSKTVLQLTSDGKIIAEYKSAMEAERQTGIKHIPSVCRKERKTAGGYRWEYKEPD